MTCSPASKTINIVKVNGHKHIYVAYVHRPGNNYKKLRHYCYLHAAVELHVSLYKKLCLENRLMSICNKKITKKKKIQPRPACSVFYPLMHILD